MISITMALVIGLALPFQTTINSRLRDVVRSSFFASFISFFIGTLFLGLITLISTGSILINHKILENNPLWIWIGGILGIVFLTSNIVLFPKLGSVQTVIMPIIGQIIMGLLIDQFGLFDSNTHHITILRLFGVLMVLGGSIITVKKSSRDTSISSIHSKNKLYWQAFGIFSGLIVSTQTAINGQLGVILKSPVHAAFVSFFIGTISLLLLTLLFSGWQKPQVKRIFHEKYPLWIWLGGIIGGIYVYGNAFLVPILGTGVTIIIVLSGQIIGGLLIDQFGLLGSTINKITVKKILGIFLIALGLILVNLF